MAEAEAPRARPPAGPLRLTLRRFAEDRLAVAGAAFLAFLFAVSFLGAPLAAHLLGHGPNQLNPNAFDFVHGRRMGFWSWVPAQPTYMPHRSLYILGSDGTLGRDVFLRLLYGGQITLEIALIATTVAVLVGGALGAAAGFLGGRFGATVTWFTDLIMAFPFLIFAIAVFVTAGARLQEVRLGVLGPGVVLIAGLIALFSWFYPLRVVRAHALSLRDREFVEAARMTGASELRILRSHVVPHLAPPLIAYASVVMAGAMTAEVGLSFLNIRVPIPWASWGGLLSASWGYSTMTGSREQSHSLLFAFIPLGGVVLAVVAFTLVGEGLRRAIDPGR